MLKNTKQQKKYKTPKQQKNEKTSKNQQKNHKTIKTTNSSEQVNNVLSIFSANADGLRGKTQNLKYQVNDLNAKVFTVQETKYRTKGKLKMNEFEIYEAIRKRKRKGGYNARNT